MRKIISPLSGLLTIGFLSVCVRFVFIRNVRPAVFWDSDSYLEVAKRWLETGSIPVYGFRSLGYPLFLILTGGEQLDLEKVILIQQLLGIVSNCLLYLILYRLTASIWVSLIGAAVSITFFDLLFMEITVYSETLALFLIHLASFLFVVGFQTVRHKWLALSSSLFIWSGLALVRPAFQVAVVGIITALGVGLWRKRVP